VIDLHSHTLFSDGELVPAELVQRAETMGLEAIAITDHVDSSNLDFVLPRIIQASNDLNRHHSTKLLAGCELTHVPPEGYPKLVQKARQLGAHLVVAHGETLVEPVPAGTNLAAIKAGVDILAHPGLISDEEAELAARMDVKVELSARKGHCLGNGCTVRMAEKHGFKLVLNTDSHSPGDLIDQAQAERVALGAGLERSQLARLWQNSADMVNRALAG
jgi:putative hydrolase